MQLRKLGNCAKDFQWLGSPWSSRKKRIHYKSFQRNGVRISVSAIFLVLDAFLFLIVLFFGYLTHSCSVFLSIFPGS